MRSRKPPLAEIGDVERGFVACHLGNVVQRMGDIRETLPFQAEGLRFPGHAEANRFLSREYRRPFVIPDNI